MTSGSESGSAAAAAIAGADAGIRPTQIHITLHTLTYADIRYAYDTHTLL